ncbi:MAG: ATP-binding cassette domain-containing protein [Spirochaetaceae bacterium]|jgi:ABC-type multidrug transport system ATPase subunit|nr:ATP-binding cassette domain-containing protein [Spirochaetaceae bacterium]
MKNILELKEVSFSTQNIQIIQGINLGFEEGKTTALAGPSGCGKSTLLKLSAGLIIPTGGEALYRGKNIGGMNRAQNLEFRKESAFVFQDSALWANQTLLQSLELPLRIHFPRMTKTERQKRIEEVMNTVGYKRSLAIRPSSLSMGEQKLIAFGRSMLCSPSLLFLDEWTESLDDHAAQRLITLVKQQKLRNNTIVFVSHNLHIIRELADHVITLAEGRTYTRLTSEQIKSDRELVELLEKDKIE